MRTPTTYRGDDRSAGEPFRRTGSTRARPPAGAHRGGEQTHDVPTQPTRRSLPAALLLTALLLIVPAASATAATRRTRATAGSPPKVCPIDWREGTWHVKKLIRCAAHHWGVPGGADKALYIAHRESRFDPGAYNSYSRRQGHLSST